MNSAIQQVAQAVLSDPTLRQRLTSAASVQDRAAILQEAGVTLPSQDDLREAFAALTGVSGAGTTTTTPSGKKNHPDQGGGSGGTVSPDDLEGASVAGAAAVA